MKAVQKVLLGLGLSLFVSSGLYASEDYMGDHMHEGKMTNHMNMDGMTDEEMKKMHEEMKKNMKEK